MLAVWAAASAERALPLAEVQARVTCAPLRPSRVSWVSLVGSCGLDRSAPSRPSALVAAIATATALAAVQ